jgi:hypothetical protein
VVFAGAGSLHLRRLKPQFGLFGLLFVMFAGAGSLHLRRLNRSSAPWPRADH